MSDLTGRTLQGRYKVIRRIGDGAMSDVYLAHHRQHPGVRFALKVLKAHWAAHGDFGRRFRAEGKVLERLDHPGIVRVHDVFEENGHSCMVLAFVEGRSLADRIAERGAMDPARALPLFMAVLDALDYAHQRGVVHRDVKPSNILVDADDQPRLCDFGIAKQVGERGMTVSGISLGTPAYMSPEQIQTPNDVDHRTDLYSAGIVLYEMLTGRVPFGADSNESDYRILQDQVHKEPPDPRLYAPGLDPGLAAVLAKALRKEPGRRMQGGSEFRDAIERAPRGMGSSAGFASGRHRAPPRPSGGHESSPDGAPRRYVVYEHPTLGPVEVRRGICLPALVAGPLWLLSKRLYARAGLWLFAELVLGSMIALLNMQIHDGSARPLVLGLCAAAALIWIMPAFRGNQWREEALEHHGYVAVD